MDPSPSTSEKLQEQVLLIGVLQQGTSEREVQDSLDELEQLALTAGARVQERILCKQKTPHPATYIGKGKAAELGRRVKEGDIHSVIFDDDLTPAQSRNLEELIQTKVVDRTQVILDIFAQHAQTKEGRLQIELAQHEYLLPRLRRLWTHLERQQGGIGLRGPGEKQLEMDRQRIHVHMRSLKRELDQVRSRRSEQRRGRRRHGWALLTLVGYTNAGKSTFLNRLSGAEVKACDQLFSTLDPTTRKLDLSNHQSVLLSDTVGFIRKLPHHLVESFKATLEEVVEADYLVHVVDASHPYADQQIEAVFEVLRDLGALDKPMITVLNKLDRPTAQQQWKRLASQLDRAVPLSARTGEGIDAFKDVLIDCLKNRNVTVDLSIPLSEGKFISMLRGAGKILHEDYEDSTLRVKANIPSKMLGKCSPYMISTGE